MLDWLFGKKKVEQRILTNDDAQNAFDFKFFDKSGLAARVYPQAADIVPLHPDAAPIRMKDYDYSTEEGRRKAALDPRIPTLDFVRPNDAEVNKLWELVRAGKKNEAVRLGKTLEEAGYVFPPLPESIDPDGTEKYMMPQIAGIKNSGNVYCPWNTIEFVEENREFYTNDDMPKEYFGSFIMGRQTFDGEEYDDKKPVKNWGVVSNLEDRIIDRRHTRPLDVIDVTNPKIGERMRTYQAMHTGVSKLEYEHEFLKNIIIEGLGSRGPGEYRDLAKDLVTEYEIIQRPILMSRMLRAHIGESSLPIISGMGNQEYRNTPLPSGDMKFVPLDMGAEGTQDWHALYMDFASVSLWNDSFIEQEKHATADDKEFAERIRRCKELGRMLDRITNRLMLEKKYHKFEEIVTWFGATDDKEHSAVSAANELKVTSMAEFYKRRDPRGKNPIEDGWFRLKSTPDSLNNILRNRSPDFLGENNQNLPTRTVRNPWSNTKEFRKYIGKYQDEYDAALYEYEHPEVAADKKNRENREQSLRLGRPLDYIDTLTADSPEIKEAVAIRYKWAKIHYDFMKQNIAYQVLNYWGNFFVDIWGRAAKFTPRELKVLEEMGITIDGARYNFFNGRELDTPLSPEELKIAQVPQENELSDDKEKDKEKQEIQDRHRLLVTAFRRFIKERDMILGRIFKSRVRFEAVPVTSENGQSRYHARYKSMVNRYKFYSFEELLKSYRNISIELAKKKKTLETERVEIAKLLGHIGGAIRYQYRPQVRRRSQKSPIAYALDIVETRKDYTDIKNARKYLNPNLLDASFSLTSYGRVLYSETEEERADRIKKLAASDPHDPALLEIDPERFTGFTEGPLPLNEMGDIATWRTGEYTHLKYLRFAGQYNGFLMDATEPRKQSEYMSELKRYEKKSFDSKNSPAAQKHLSNKWMGPAEIVHRNAEWLSEEWKKKKHLNDRDRAGLVAMDVTPDGLASEMFDFLKVRLGVEELGNTYANRLNLLRERTGVEFNKFYEWLANKSEYAAKLQNIHEEWDVGVNRFNPDRMNHFNSIVNLDTTKEKKEEIRQRYLIASRNKYSLLPERLYWKARSESIEFISKEDGGRGQPCPKAKNYRDKFEYAKAAIYFELNEVCRGMQEVLRQLWRVDTPQEAANNHGMLLGSPYYMQVLKKEVERAKETFKKSMQEITLTEAPRPLKGYMYDDTTKRAFAIWMSARERKKMKKNGSERTRLPAPDMPPAEPER